VLFVVNEVSLMQLSFSTLACPNFTWHQTLEAAAQSGYDGVEIRMLEGETDLRKIADLARDRWPERRAELIRAGVEVCVLSSSIRFDHAAPADREAHQQMGRDYIDMALALGCRKIRVFGDVLHPEDSREAGLQRIADGLNRLADEGHRAGVEILLETHGDFTATPVLRELLARVQSPGFGLLWDTHHPWRFHGEPVAETWRAIGSLVRHTHWKDSVAERTRPLTEEEREAEARAKSINVGHRTAHYALYGEGEFPIRETVELLHGSGYDGWYSLEWEKAWHPELAGPEESLPGFVRVMRGL
jgi:sugar phosphate isomerase/epimerase